MPRARTEPKGSTTIRIHVDTFEALVSLAMYKDSMDDIVRRLLKESKWAKSRARGAGSLRALRRL